MTEVDFNTFLRVLDSVSRLANINCIATLESITFSVYVEVEKKYDYFARIDRDCKFFLEDATKGDSNVQKEY